MWAEEAVAAGLSVNRKAPLVLTKVWPAPVPVTARVEAAELPLCTTNEFSVRPARPVRLAERASRMFAVAPPAA